MSACWLGSRPSAKSEVSAPALLGQGRARFNASRHFIGNFVSRSKTMRRGHGKKYFKYLDASTTAAMASPDRGRSTSFFKHNSWSDSGLLCQRWAMRTFNLL